jgi:hypothetical protein
VSAIDTSLMVDACNTRTLRRFPLLSLRAGSSEAPSPPGPILLLRDFFADFFLGDKLGSLKAAPAPATSPSAIFSLPLAIVVVWCGVVVGVECGGMRP